MGNLLSSDTEIDDRQFIYKYIATIDRESEPYIPYALYYDNKGELGRGIF